ncbi:MAG: carbonic anhydrase [Deltaproteobacteria bacterium]|nr:carbonic anhydrase [Deltaproteobacteria bacterium]
MRDLIMGIVDFREHLLSQYATRFRDLSYAQSPDALFITCADSRVVPDLLASTEPGELFTMRNVGNLIPPASAEGVSIGDVSEASAIEYAVLVLEVANIVVCGHSECGAMKAVLARAPKPEAPNLEKWLHHATAAAFRLEHEGPLDPSLTAHNQLSQLNVLVQLEHLMTYPIVRSRVNSGALHLSAWWFDIATGAMQAYDRERRTFEIIDRAVAEKLVARLGPVADPTPAPRA